MSFNPVRARLVERPEDWRWSSVRAHLAGDAQWRKLVRKEQDRPREPWYVTMRHKPESSAGR